MPGPPPPTDDPLAELTGFPDGPAVRAPAGFLHRLRTLTDRIEQASAALGRPAVVDGVRTLTERATAMGLHRRGQVSCGGSTHLVAAIDGWFAVTLSRPDDLSLLPAWIDAPAADDPWAEVHRRCRDRPVREVVDRGILLGLPIAVLGSAQPRAEAAPSPAGLRRPRDASRLVNVVDLSSMWAGPLCGALLAEAGARVTKVELASRPDGARLGPARFYERLNGAKATLTIDMARPDGLRRLVDTIASADVVIESSRPRALAQLGIDAETLVADPAGPQVWVSITGHGRYGEAANRVAFGDDAAVAGGLVAWAAPDRPCFFADAVADPLTGLTAAAEALEALAIGRTVLLDIAMAGVAAALR